MSSRWNSQFRFVRVRRSDPRLRRATTFTLALYESNPEAPVKMAPGEFVSCAANAALVARYPLSRNWENVPELPS